MTVKSTPLTEWHKQHGAKMAPFAGWDMPIQYTGILQEHEHTRKLASIFDISHMGEFIVSGKGALSGLSYALSTNLATLAQGKCRYGFLLNEMGGIIDDLISYRLGDEEFLLVVNASCIELDYSTLSRRLPDGVSLKNISDEIAKIDLQGPASLDVLTAALPYDWKKLPYFSFCEIACAGEKALVSRTGYTGELGYELYIPASKAIKIWELLLATTQVKPAGLGARDTLRLEAGLPLNGQDLDPAHTPAEAGYKDMLTSEAAYVGKEKALGVRQILTALTIPGRRSARHGNRVFLPTGQEAGMVTSASFCPSLGYAVALAYLDKEYARQDKYMIQADRARLEAVRTELPFYKEGTARKKTA